MLSSLKESNHGFSPYAVPVPHGILCLKEILLYCEISQVGLFVMIVLRFVELRELEPRVLCPFKDIEWQGDSINIMAN